MTRVDFQLNDKIVTEMSVGFDKACKINQDCHEAQINRLLL